MLRTTLTKGLSILNFLMTGASLKIETPCKFTYRLLKDTKSVGFSRSFTVSPMMVKDSAYGFSFIF